MKSSISMKPTSSSSKKTGYKRGRDSGAEQSSKMSSKREEAA